MCRGLRCAPGYRVINDLRRSNQLARKLFRESLREFFVNQLRVATQPRELSGRVVCREPSRAVAQQILSISEPCACRPLQSSSVSDCKASAGADRKRITVADYEEQISINRHSRRRSAGAPTPRQKLLAKRARNVRAVVALLAACMATVLLTQPM